MLLKEGLCTDSHTRWGGALCKHSTTTHKYRHSPKNMLLSIAPQARGFAVFPLWCPASVCVSMDSSLGMSHTLLRGVCVSACVFNPTAASVASLHAARRCCLWTSVSASLSLSPRTGPPLPLSSPPLLFSASLPSSSSSYLPPPSPLWPLHELNPCSSFFSLSEVCICIFQQQLLLHKCLFRSL